MSDKMREAFEEEMVRLGHFPDGTEFTHDSEGAYIHEPAQIAWEAAQWAALTQQPESGPVAEKEIEELLEKRDDLEDMCDRLSARISELTGVDVGEHTSANCPWTNALEAPDPQPTPQVPEGWKPDAVTSEMITAGLVAWDNAHGEGVRKWMKILEVVFVAMANASPSIAEKREPDQPELPLVDGYALLPRELTAENGAKKLLMGEFEEAAEVHCGYCDGDAEGDDCEFCDGSGVYEFRLPVQWSTIKDIHRMVVEHLASTCTTPALDLVAHLHRQREFSARTFGPGARVAGILDHMRKEMLEVEENPRDVTEWIDLAILAFDGAWRTGYSPEQIAVALEDKQAKNESRQWPDWRTVPRDKAIEHDRTAEVAK